MDFDLYRLVDQVLQPHTLLHLLIATALVVVWRKKPELRRQLAWVAVPFALLTLISLPAVSHFALGSMEWRYPPALDRPPDAQAIVILAGGIRYADQVRLRPELDYDTMLRCLHGAELYRCGQPCPVVVTSGPQKPGGPGPSCAEVMRDFLVSLGIPEQDILLESQSRTTFENATLCRALLEPRGIKRIVLVTDALHMYRSLRCFGAQGFDAVPSACRHGATRFSLSFEAFLPNPAAANDCRRVAHEWLGLVWYKLKGRI
jgi:uncharacterized SAM-binding protein YcdF (DUF218 family)